jgi:hypothetical protein
LIAVGVLFACLGGLGAAFAWQQVTHAVSAVVVQVPQSRGDVIEAGDLGVLDVAASGDVDFIPADRITEFLGRQAAADLASGTILTEASVIPTETPPANTAVIGLTLNTAQFPGGPLPVGTRVVLVQVPVMGQDILTSPAQFGATIHTAATALPDGSTWAFSLTVDPTDAPQIAALAAAGSLALVRLGAS